MCNQEHVGPASLPADGAGPGKLRHFVAFGCNDGKTIVVFGGNAFFTQEDVEAYEATRDIEKTWSKRMKDTHLPVYGDDLQPMWGAAIDAWTEIVKRGGEICVEEARGLGCPTLVLHGAKDPICYQSHAEWFRDNIPSAQLRVLPEGKHNLHLKFADEVNGMIRAFVEGREVPQP